MPLKGKTIFITGATSGFGEACARLFAAQGARLILSGRRVERLEKLKKEISCHPEHSEGSLQGSFVKTQDDKINTLAFDVRDNEAVKKAIASLPNDFSDVDMLINNAGLALGIGSYETQAMEDLEQMVDTNVKGLMYMTHALLPGMITRNRGHIVNVGSVAGVYPYPGGNVYGGTKAFVEQFSLNLRADLLGKNIRVTVIEPGMAETEFSLVRFHGDAPKAGSVYEGVKALTAEDIANSILWCISQPEHVNINRIELMPTQQAFSPFAVDRRPT